MFELATQFNLDLIDWFLISLCGVIIGMSKTGVPGISMIVIPTLAYIFGGKQSTGILLPILIMADFFAVRYYHRHADWKHLLKLLPWALGGVLVAMWTGEQVDDKQFKHLIAITVFASIGLMIWRDRKKEQIIPSTWWFAALMGTAGGFATMIGNAAGPIFSIYLLAMHLPKNKFIGTGAWFYLIINLSKFPLHVGVWKTINWSTLTIDIVTLPVIALGAWLGVKVVKRIPENTYRWFVIIITILSAFLLLI
ncbi:sulfite exporter TauE/SafE family protein [Prolixibacteraceae bacterium JC049]|nr:sulfite exporter TauE/SafE family protein [Prolixibacteraceae bacterium JC049]